MEKRLYEASFAGEVTTLKTLLQEDPLILERSTSLTPFHETPLHVSILRGHLEFTRALLSHNPKLATESDSLSRLPLHVAATKGHVDIVGELLRVDPGACVARDRDGNTPLEAVIVKGGPVEVVKQLTRASPDLTRVAGDRGQSVYHLCVKHNNLEVFKVLVEEFGGRNDNINLLNAGDDDGNTVFHLAVLHKHLEIIKYLVSKSDIDQNAVNKRGLTPLNLIQNSPKDLQGLEILNFLLESNGPSNTGPASTSGARSRRTRSRANSWNRFFTFNGKNHLEDFRGELFIVSTIIVAIAALPVIYLKTSFGSLLDAHYIISTLSLVPALSIMLLLVSGLSLENKFCVWLVMQLMYTAVGFTGWSYLRAIISDDEQHVHLRVNDTVIVMCIWFGLLVIVSLLNTVRLFALVGTRVTSCTKRRTDIQH